MSVLSDQASFGENNIKKNENYKPILMLRKNEEHVEDTGSEMENYVKLKNKPEEYKCDYFVKQELEETVCPYACDKCSYKAIMFADLKLHDIVIHRNSKYPCEHCDFHTNKKPVFIKHMESAHGTKIAF